MEEEGDVEEWRRMSLGVGDVRLGWDQPGGRAVSFLPLMSPAEAQRRVEAAALSAAGRGAGCAAGAGRHQPRWVLRQEQERGCAQPIVG